MLEKIKSSEDVKKLSKQEKTELAEEIRKYILEVVSENGGHLASNLGVVELTIALHSVFDMSKDKIIWDVGHQSYVHKILTGRKEQLKTLRKLDGIAGFPKTNECEADCFNTGHSSTSISAALGMARARDIKKENNSVIAVIGDGALTGGMAFEGLNDAGCNKTKPPVFFEILISLSFKITVSLSMMLSKIRTRKSYTKPNISAKKVILKIPVVGKTVVRIVQKFKGSIKQLVIPKMFLEDIGFRYLGPVDGHNEAELERMLNITKQLDGPVLLHVITKKGKGYKIAEENPDKFHATGPFEIDTGKSKKEKSKDYSKVLGDKLVELAQNDDKIVAITAAMKDGTGLTEFANKFPDRFFDVGIAEQHALCMAAGMAKEGMKPVVPIYSSFYQRGYDQVIHDIAIQKLPVVMCVDRAGIVGADGETHQGLLDMAFFRIVPNLTIMAPKDFVEFENMIEFAIKLGKPVVIRYPRGGEDKYKFNKEEKIELGKAETLTYGKNATIIAIGKTVSKAVKIAEKLEKVEVINARFLKPLDVEKIKESIAKTKNVIVIEDGTSVGGLTTAIKELIVDENLKNIKFKSFAYPDKFIEHGSVEELEKRYNVDENAIKRYVELQIKEKEKNN